MYSRFFSHSPFSAQLTHIWLISVHFFLVFLVFSVYPTNACSRYSYWWWWRVPSLLSPLLPIKFPLASTRTKRDFGRWRLCPPGFGENHPGERKTTRKRKKKALPKRKGKGKGKPETRKRVRSIIRSAKERERERKEALRKSGRVLTVDFAVVFPDKSIRRGKRTSRARNARAHRFAKL